ncbi:hypothetical protein CDL12_24809 [Handroanthus impetiginosus]|uniref:Uncharacterized protein n=1 Tax=Handroanthus impetiginosus TaxID=429701 RepID=A0A2G9GBM3_9LAMI|nr:hypothetical protein CDL12_24809 [Handroanthus impetiginosus]
MSTASRRTKWHPTPPPPPTPKILHFPLSRRTRRKQTKPTTQQHLNNNPLLLMHQKYLSYKGKLENLFDEENNESPMEILNSNSNSKRRERVEEQEEEEEEKLQAEILRAECNFLRMEREFALKKLEKNRVKMERTLRSAVQTLASGRKKIFEGKNVNSVLEEEIEDLAEKLEDLQKSSRIKDHEVDMVRKEMEGRSKGILERVEEEYSSILCSTANSSVASSASTSKRIECPDLSSCYNRQSYKEPILLDNKCSGRCKSIVRRIVEQVRTETEQWSQMQEMLGQVRGEMEQLQTSRDFWENRAHSSDNEIQSLKRAVEEWNEKALGYENKAKELQLELSQLKEEIRKSKSSPNQIDISPVPLGKQLEKEKFVLSRRFKKNHNHIDEENNERRTPTKDLPPLSLGKQLAKEKNMRIRHLSENHWASEKGGNQEISVDGKRKHLRDIGNISSPLARQNSRGVFPFHSPENCSFRK